MIDAAIIGGGISGLATACELADRGHRVRVLERQVVAGGSAVSERFGGWLMEHGPTTLNAAFLPTASLVERLGLDRAAEPLGPGVRKRYLRDKGRLSGISTHPLGFLLSNYLSPLEKLSLAAEIARPRRRGQGDESLHAFATRRFGRGFADRVVDPMAAGIFMADARELSAAAAFPRLVEFEARFGSVLRAIIAARRGGDPGRQLFSWAGGVATLPGRMAARLGDTVKTGIAVTGIARLADGFDIATARDGTLRARTVVLAVQPHVAAGLMAALDDRAGGALGAIAAPPVAVVFLGFRREQVAHPLDGLGFLSTRAESQVISGVQFPSTMFPSRAPEGHVALSAYIGGSRSPEAARLPSEELSAIVLSELRPLLGLAAAPVVTRVRHWERGLPQYALGHNERRADVDAAQDRLPGLYLTGNYLAGVSITSCLEQAARTAERADRFLTSCASGPIPLGALRRCGSIGGTRADAGLAR